MKAYRKTIVASISLPVLYLFLSNFFTPTLHFGNAKSDHFGGLFGWFWLNRENTFLDIFELQKFTNYPEGELNNSYLFVTTLFERLVGLFLTRIFNEQAAFNLLFILSFIVCFWSMVIACSILKIELNKSLIVALSFVSTNTIVTYGITNFNYLFLAVGIPAYLLISKYIEFKSFKRIFLPTFVIGILGYVDGYGLLHTYIYLLSLFVSIALNFHTHKIKNYTKIILTIILINLPQIILFFYHGRVSDLPLRDANEGEKYQLKFLSIFSENELENNLNGNFELNGLYVGSTTIVISLLSIVLMYLALKLRKLQKVVIDSLILLIVTILISLGPTIKLGNSDFPNILVEIFPLSSHLRVYSRLQVIIVFVLFVLFYFLFSDLKLNPKLNLIILSLVLISSALELYHKSQEQLYYNSRNIPGAYLWLSEKEDDFVVADLLQKTPDNYFLRYQSTHEKRTINAIYKSNLFLANGLGVYDENTGCILSHSGARYAIWHGTLEQLQNLQSANDMKLVKKFPKSEIGQRAYHNLSNIDDGSSAIFKINVTDRNPKYLIDFIDGFEAPAVNNNVGIWSSSLQSTIKFSVLSEVVDQKSLSIFSFTAYALDENYLWIKQDDKVIWYGLVTSLGTQIKIEVDLNKPLHLSTSNLQSPSEMNFGSSDKRKLGLFFTDYTDSICE